MQHYGSKTPLVDFTFNPYVALAFAEAYDDSVSHAIWAIRKDAIYSDQRIWDKNFKSSIFEGLFHEVQHMRVVPPSYRERGVETQEQIAHLIRRANALLEIAPEDEDDVKPGIQPLYLSNNNRRQDTQFGLFLLANSLGPFAENVAYTLQTDVDWINEPPGFADIRYFERNIERWNQMSFVKLVLTGEFAKCAKNILKRAQISEATLFPDLVGLARSVTYNKSRRRL